MLQNKGGDDVSNPPTYDRRTVWISLRIQVTARSYMRSVMAPSSLTFEFGRMGGSCEVRPGPLCPRFPLGSAQPRIPRDAPCRGDCLFAPRRESHTSRHTREATSHPQHGCAAEEGPRGRR
ncbi:hypothetical protein GQ600_3042 [Phytophthora cactorum]|nr:hypothetical protein GQ600_3042 [Phytophthora cactorum]